MPYERIRTDMDDDAEPVFHVNSRYTGKIPFGVFIVTL